MNLAHQQPSWTPESFLDWERQQEARWEFDGFQPVAMVGARVGHQRIIRLVEQALRRRTPCEVFTETVRLKVGSKFRYPDVMVVCSRVPGDALYVEDPVIVVEVLSDDAHIDRIDKNQEYAGLPSVRHYVMLEQDRPAATVFSRVGGAWVGSLAIGRETLVRLPAIDAEIPLGEFYPENGDEPAT